MPSLHPNDVIADLPVDEWQHSLHAFLQPVTTPLPNVRLRAVAELITPGILFRGDFNLWVITGFDTHHI